MAIQTAVSPLQLLLPPPINEQTDCIVQSRAGITNVSVKFTLTSTETGNLTRNFLVTTTCSGQKAQSKSTSNIKLCAPQRNKSNSVSNGWLVILLPVRKISD